MSKNSKQLRGQVLPYSISQNFLTSRKTIDRLLRKTTITKEDTVLEIGAGKGHITKALSNVCKNVITYEIDRKLYEKLKTQLPENVKLYGTDFLQCHLPKTRYKVFANIPFSKTTVIMKKLTTASTLPEAIWLVMEKGAAKRFCGIPKENVNSLLLKPFFDTKIVYHFNREDFHPSPKTDIVLLELKRKQTADILPSQRSQFSSFLMYHFQNGLFGSKALLTKKQISMALKTAGLPAIQPSGDILYIQWLCLFRCWLQYGKKIGF